MSDEYPLALADKVFGRNGTITAAAAIARRRLPILLNKLLAGLPGALAAGITA